MADVKNNMVHGIKPVLEALRTLERETYKIIEQDLKDSTNDLRVAVMNDFPDKPWKSSTGVINWTKYGRTKAGKRPKGGEGASFPRWQSSKVKRGVQVKVGGRKVRRTNSYPILRVVQSNAAGSVFDLAKNADTTAGTTFVSNLQSSGQPSRVMWKSVKKNYPLVEHKVMKILDEVGKRFTVQIANQTDRRNAQSIRASKQARTALGRFGKVL
jgi:hypothetical protein